jgi:hypothetical protein
MACNKDSDIHHSDIAPLHFPALQVGGAIEPILLRKSQQMLCVIHRLKAQKACM